MARYGLGPEEAIEVQVRDYQPDYQHDYRSGDRPEAPAPAPTPTVPVGTPGRPHSRLGRFVLSLAALGLGLLGVVDLAGARIAGSAYLAVPLAVVGLGLLAGAWYGRARWLIAPGAVLSIALAVTGAAENLAATDHSFTWRPTGIEQLQSSYTIDVGNAVLDLSAVDFTGQNRSVRVHVGVGNLTVVVPTDVDVRAEVEVDVGNADVLGRNWSGIGRSGRTVVDDGADGPGGGELDLQATVDVGDVEVRR